MENLDSNERFDENRDITIHLKAADFVPDEADFERRCARLRERPGDAMAYTLGGLMTNMEGIGRAIDEGDGRYLALHVRWALACIAAYEAVQAEVLRVDLPHTPETSA